MHNVELVNVLQTLDTIEYVTTLLIVCVGINMACSALTDFGHICMLGSMIQFLYTHHCYDAALQVCQYIKFVCNKLGVEYKIVSKPTIKCSYYLFDAVQVEESVNNYITTKINPAKAAALIISSPVSAALPVATVLPVAAALPVSAALPVAPDPMPEYETDSPKSPLTTLEEWLWEEERR